MRRRSRAGAAATIGTSAGSSCSTSATASCSATAGLGSDVGRLAGRDELGPRRLLGELLLEERALDPGQRPLRHLDRLDGRRSIDRRRLDCRGIRLRPAQLPRGIRRPPAAGGRGPPATGRRAGPRRVPARSPAGRGRWGRGWPSRVGARRTMWIGSSPRSRARPRAQPKTPLRTRSRDAFAPRSRTRVTGPGLSTYDRLPPIQLTWTADSPTSSRTLSSVTISASPSAPSRAPTAMSAKPTGGRHDDQSRRRSRHRRRRRSGTGRPAAAGASGRA